MTDKLTFAGSVELQAAKADKPATVSIMAYTGGIMSVDGFGHVLIEASGVTLPPSIPLLADHDNRLGSIVGTGAPASDGKSITVSGTISRNSPAGQSVLALHGDGVALQASVGLTPTERKFVAAGESIKANGQTFTAPARGLTYVSKGQLYEVSLVAIGADANTNVSIAAKGKPMSELTTNPEDILKAERQRVQSIDAACRGDWFEAQAEVDDLRAKALAGEIDTNELQGHLLRIIRASRPVHQGGVKMHRGAGNGTASPDMLAASLLIRSGHEGVAVKAYGADAADQARRMGITNLPDLCAAALRQAGHEPASYGSREQMIRAAFSTSSLPNILSNVTGKVLEASYLETTSDWTKFAYIASADTFHTQRAIRPSAIENLEKLGNGGEIKHGTLSEEDTFTWKVDTFAKMISVTRTDIVNDDLGVFAEISPMLGTAAGRKLLDLIYELVIDGETDLHFAAGNGNLANPGADLDVTSLGEAVAAMRNQKDNAGNNIAIRPAVLLVPTSLELTARALLNSAEILGPSTAQTPAGNPVSGIVADLVVEPRLENSVKFTNASADAWYLFGPPSSRPLTVGFLQGKRAPTVEIADASFDTLGVSMRAFHDFGVAWGDARASYKNSGTAGTGG